MRGPSGSGKSTYVSDKYPEAIVCSADGFFMRSGEDIESPALRRIPRPPEEKVYDFNPSQLGQAHAWCHGKVLEAMNNGCKKNTIVVDNTLIHLWECQNYIDLGLMMGYKIEIIEIGVETIVQLKACIKRNAHRVPTEVVAKMALEFEPFCIDPDDMRRFHIVIRKLPMKGVSGV